MIENKDFVMRIISRIGALLRLILKGQADHATELEVEDALAELAGLPTTMLLGMTPDSMVALLRKLPNPDTLATAAALLIMKGRLAKNPAYEASGHKIIATLNPNGLSPDVRQLIADLTK